MNTVIEHTVQRDILGRLTHVKALRFSELKPAGMENNAFMYHLKQLMVMGYVSQQPDKSYLLTPRGLSYVDTLTLVNKKPRKQPKIIGVIALNDGEGRYLLAKRLVQPTINTWMVPSGKRHFGESPDMHAMRQTREWIDADIELERRGFLDVRIQHGDELVSHVAGHVYGGVYKGEPPDDTEKFHFEWHAPTSGLHFTPGTRELLQALEGGDEFFLSLDVNVD